MTREKTKEDALVDELLKDYSDPKEILGENGLLKVLQKKLVERALEGSWGTTSVTRRTIRRAAATAAMARARRRCRAIRGSSASRCHGIETAALSRRL